MPKTWEILPALGFSEIPVQWPVGLAYEIDLGSFPLTAAQSTNKYFREVIHFSGSLTTPTSTAEVSFELPVEMDSPAQCKAFIAYYLRNHLDKNDSRQSLEWIIEGEGLAHLLPWEIEKAMLDSRTRCWVRRDWLKLALKDLESYRRNVTGHTLVEISFDGRVLIFRVRDDQIVLTAEGDPWDETYVIHAARLQSLPKRFNSGTPEISIWDAYLTIGGCRYRGVFGKPDWIYWKPDPEGGTFVMDSSRRNVAGAIRCWRGQEMSFGIYWSLLADRVEDYALNSSDPGESVAWAAQRLNDTAALDYHNVDVENCGGAFVGGNLDLQERLYLAGIPGDLPKTIDESVDGAEEVYFRTDLTAWANAVAY